DRRVRRGGAPPRHPPQALLERHAGTAVLLHGGPLPGRHLCLRRGAERRRRLLPGPVHGGAGAPESRRQDDRLHEPQPGHGQVGVLDRHVAGPREDPDEGRDRRGCRGVRRAARLMDDGPGLITTSRRALRRFFELAAGALSRVAPLIYRSERERATRRRLAEERQWYTDRGDETLRLAYDLGPETLVMDAGGYHGNWSADLFC